MTSMVVQAGYPDPSWNGHAMPWAPPVYLPPPVAPQPRMRPDQYVPAWPQAPYQPTGAYPQAPYQPTGMYPQAPYQPTGTYPQAPYPMAGQTLGQQIANFFASILAVFRRSPVQPQPAPVTPLPPMPLPAPPEPQPAPMPPVALPTPPAAPAPQPMAVPAAPPAIPVPGPQAIVPAIWLGPPGPLEGFDYQKLNDPNHRTVKYAFARCVNGISLASVRDQGSAEALLRSLLPRFQSAGMQVLDVRGDKILVVTEIGPEWVDVIRGAGGGNPGWWWGSEGRPAPGVAAPPYVPPHGQPAPLPAIPVPVPVPVPMPTPSPVPPPGGAPLPGALPALQTVPALPEYNRPIPRSSPEAAILETARYVKATYPHLFADDDRAKHYEAMTHVIGILRANGLDAHRVVNHPSRPVGDPWRYGSDALVLDGTIYDVYRGIGDPNASVPQAANMGPYGPGRARE